MHFQLFFKSNSNKKYFLGIYHNIYIEAEHKAQQITRLFTALFIVASIFVIIPSLLQTLHLVFISNGNLNEVYVLPIILNLPFQVDTWLKYAFAFCFTTINVMTVATFKIVASPIQFAFCFHTMAIMKDLQLLATAFNEKELRFNIFFSVNF